MNKTSSIHVSKWLYLSLLLIGVAGYCEVCHLQNDHTKDYSTPFEADPIFYKHCRQYKDNACCSLETVNDFMALYPGYEFNRCDDDPTIPNKMSDECYQYFINELCFYECDVNAGKYRKHPDCEDNSWQMEGMPIKASYCDEWFQACADDFVCACRPEDDCEAPKSQFALPKLNCTYDGGQGNCQKVKDIFQDGKELCELMFDNSFIYYEDEPNAYTMFFEENQTNPNNQIHAQVPHPQICPNQQFNESIPEACEGLDRPPIIVPHTCEVCQLRNPHTLDNAKPAFGDLGGCSKYSQYSCCSEDTAKAIFAEEANETLYGELYQWSRCYENRSEIPEKCHRWFMEEECFYECDVNAGKYRLHEECGENSWEIQSLPLKASECDQWYEDCKDALLCVCTDNNNCPEGTTAYSIYSQIARNCTEDECQKVSDLYADGKEWCNKLYGKAFVYEEHEKAAYSIAWDKELLFNPNNFVNTHIEFPDNCPGHNATKEQCNIPSID
eukprot:TRINITY_DN4155_c0_g2_i1.p1 TRINITY_DN4155_c0_g2~~TRINITY_DN4155_c0_g2_i1.p1  ORF type:complete len:499 (-),score=60.13 TRINITY_DN4155_c0_g2_i1:133-1629(-)